MLNIQFGKIKTLTQDEAVLREALADSTAVSIVDDRIKSNLKSTGRSTIILRDIASDVPEEEVRSIFAYDGCKPISSVRKDIENTWFVFMDSEEDAKDTVLDLKLKKRMFRGEPVKCRLKTEVVVKSYFPVASQSASSQAGYSGSGGYGMMPQYAQDMRMYSGYGWQNGQQNGDFNKGDIDSPGRSSGSVQSKDGASRAAAPSPKDGVRKDQLKAGGSRDGNVGRDRIKQGVGATQQQRGKDGSGRNQVPGRNGQSGKTGKGEKGMWVEGGKAGHRAPSFDLSGMNFPPLATSEGATAIPQPGYKGPFTKYTHDEIIHIVKNISKVVLPSSIEPELHGDAMTHTVNMDLLHRQRTFSIDETREQLRQGKPVQREAVVSGAVDMESMYYGDSVAPNVPPAPVVPTVPTTTSSSSTKPSGSWAGVLMKSGPPEVAPQKIAVAATPKKVPVEPVVAAVPEVVAVEDKKGDAKPLSGDKKGKGKDNKGKDGKVRFFSHDLFGHL